MIIIYGIPNCDTVKKARTWLTGHGKAFQFHDFKTQGVPAQNLARWADKAGWEKLINRKGTTWRKLDVNVQAAVIDTASAQALMRENASVIKRPVVEWDQCGDITVGFDTNDWTARL